MSVQQLMELQWDGNCIAACETGRGWPVSAPHVRCVYLFYSAPLLSGGADARILLAAPYRCMSLWPLVLVWGAAVPSLGPCNAMWYAGRGFPSFAPLLCPPSLCSYTGAMQ